MPRIHLIRHGRSAHVHAGWIDVDGFHRWRESYEAAAIAEGEEPPAALRELARTARVIAASNAPRAIASAKLLDDEIVISPLLRELELRPMNLRGIKLPLIAWALTFALRRTLATPDEEARAGEAAGWLEELAHEGDVVAVTHQTFRGLLAKALMARGWSGKKPPGWHWSAWMLEKRSS